MPGRRSAALAGRVQVQPAPLLLADGRAQDLQGNAGVQPD